MDDAGSGVGGFEPESQLAVGAAIEDGAQRQQLVDPVRAFTCKDAYRLGIGQPVAGGEGVGRMLAGAVSGPERHGDPALGPRAGAIGQRLLGDEDHREAFGCQSPRRPEAGDSGADDDGRRGSHGEIYSGAVLGGTAGQRDSNGKMLAGAVD